MSKTEIAVLTARLEAQTAAFTANMRSAEGLLNQVQRDARSLDRTMLELNKQMKDVGLDSGKIEESRRLLRQFAGSAGGLRDVFAEVGFAVDQIYIDQTKVAADIAAIDRETRAVKAQRDAYFELAAVQRFTNTRAFGGGYMTRNMTGFAGTWGGGPNALGPGQRAIGPAPYEPDWMRVQRMLGPGMRALPPGPGPPGTDFRFVRNLDYDNWLQGASRQLGSGARALPPGHDFRVSRSLIPEQDLRRVFSFVDPMATSAAESYFAKKRGGGADRIFEDLGGILSGGARRGFFGGRGGGGGGSNIFSDLYSGGGRYGGRGGRYNVPGPNFLAGILPGGSRARPAALATLALGIGALGPAAVPAAAGLGVGAAAAMTGLVGAAATLKLAFADISAAAFTSKAAFDKLTPVQQSFVLSLKSLDAGVMKPLERLAQRDLLPRLTDALHKVLSPNLIGAVQTSVGSFATNIGRGAQNVAGILGSSEFTQNFQKVMVADSFYVNQFITDIGKLGDSFFRVLAAAKPFTDWLSGLGVKFSNWIEATTRATAANGKMAQFFDHAKVGLQAFGGVVDNLLKVLGAFGDAVGFQNSIGLVKLLSDLLRYLANFLNDNKNVIRDFLGGAIAAAHDLLAALHPLVDGLSHMLNLIDRLVGGTNGWRIAIDGVVAAFTINWISGLLGSLAKLGLAEGAAIGSTKTLRLALLSLSSTQVLGGLAVLAAAVYAIYKPQAFVSPGPDPSRGQGTGIISAGLAKGLIKGKTPFATGTATAKAAYDLGGGQYLALEPNGKWKLYHMSGGVEVPGLASGFKSSPAVQAAVAATAPRGSVAGVAIAPGGLDSLNPVTAINQFLTNNLGLPPSIQQQVDAAAWKGPKAQAKAYAAARGYYLKLLAMPGLSAAQKDLIRQAGSAYAAPSPFQQTGGGALGFGGPTSAGGSVFNAQQAVVGAMGTGSGVSFSKQIELAKAYERSAAAAYEHLKNQKVVAADRAAKEAQLTKLLKDEGQARKYIAAITDHQAKAIAKMVDDSRRAQIAGHRTTISEIRANLVSRVSAAASPQAIIDAVNKALLAASSQYAQLYLLDKKLLGQSNQTAKLKAEENQIRKEMNQTLGIIHTAEKDQAKAIKAQAQGKIERKWERIFGITHGTTASVESVVRREHSALTSILKGLPHGKGVNPLSMIPGFASMTVSQQVKALESHGVTFSKHALNDFKNIQKYLDEIRKSGGKVSSVISGQITALLTQIKENTKKGGAYPNTFHVPTQHELLKGLGNLSTPKERLAFARRMAEVYTFGGKIPTGPNAAGYPVGMAHNPGGTVHIGHLIMNIDAGNSDPKVIAAKVREELLKTARHNPTQTRGPNAGRKLGLT